MRAAWPAVALMLWCVPAAAQVVSVTMQGPARDFGRFVGDLMTSTARITVLPGTVLDARSLPPIGPASAIAELRQVQTGGTQNRIEIAATYQTFFAPEQVSQADMPGYTVMFLAHGARFPAVVPGFTFSASPFRHDLQPNLDPAAMRPDHGQTPAHAPGAPWAVAAGAALMAAGLLAFLGPWPIAPRRRPFRAAAAQLGQASRKAKQHGEGISGRDALLALHRAFDATAGRRVFAEDLEEILRQHPHFAPLRDRIDSFFAASRLVFFGDNVGALDPTAWLKLCHDLARAERLG